MIKLDFNAFAAVFDTFPHGFMIAEVLVNDEGKADDFIYRYANSKFSEMIVRPLETILNKTYQEVSGQKWSRLHNFSDAAFSGIVSGFTYYVRQTNCYVHAECYQLAQGYCGCVLTDVTAEREVQRKLQMEQDSFLAVFDSTGLDHWVYDIRNDRAYQSDSSQRVLGVPPIMENYPQSFLDANLILPKYWNVYLDIYKRVRQGEPEVTGEYQIWIPDDEFPHWERLIYKTIFDEQGKPVKAIGTAIDISAQKHLEERFEDFLAYHRRKLHGMTDGFRLNITKDTIIPLKDPLGFFKNYGHLSMGRFFEKSAERIIDPSYLKKYKRIFNREKLLDTYKKGIKKETFECPYRFDDGSKRWLRFVIDMIRDPLSSNIIGITYTEDMTDDRLNDMALKLMIGYSYELMLRADMLHDTFVVFLYDGTLQPKPKQGKDAIAYLHMKDHYYLGMDQNDISLAGIWKRLQQEKAFSIYYEETDRQEKRVKKLQFYVLDEESKQFCVGRSDVTYDLFGQKQNISGGRD